MTGEEITEGLRCIAWAVRAVSGEDPSDVQPGFENDVFEMHPYCWCDGENKDHELDGCPLNFYYRTSGFAVSWYKHLGRGVDADDITKEEFNSLVFDCLRSVTPSTNS